MRIHVELFKKSITVGMLAEAHLEYLPRNDQFIFRHNYYPVEIRLPIEWKDNEDFTHVDLGEIEVVCEYEPEKKGEDPKEFKKWFEKHICTFLYTVADEVTMGFGPHPLFILFSNTFLENHDAFSVEFNWEHHELKY